MSINFEEKKGFLCDMDGVLYHGNRLLPGAAEFIHWLQTHDKKYLFLTNNSNLTPRELHQKLERLGISVPEQHFYISCEIDCFLYREIHDDRNRKKQPARKGQQGIRSSK